MLKSTNTKSCRRSYDQSTQQYWVLTTFVSLHLQREINVVLNCWQGGVFEIPLKVIVISLYVCKERLSQVWSTNKLQLIY